MPKQSDFSALVVALVVTVAMAAALVYFVRVLWPLLPAWLSMIVFIVLAVIVIGYPIYALAQWSDRYLARQQRKGKVNKDKDRSADE